MKLNVIFREAIDRNVLKKSQPFGRLVFLGTSAAVPTVSRSHPCIALWWRGEILLFDCGEGAQRQLMSASLSFERISSIFITHMHGDHVLGLPGLLMTMSLQNRRSPLNIYGPKGLRSFIESCLPMIFYQPGFPISISEVRGGLVVSGRKYKVYSREVRHSVESYAYCFKEDDRPGRFKVEKAEELGVKPGPLRSMLVEGKPVRLEDGRIIRPEEVVEPSKPGVKIVYTGDMGNTPGFEEFCVNADILIHEATFDEDMSSEAGSLQHSTCVEAAKLAAAAGVKKLILTHVSSRYGDASILLEQSKRFFKDVQIAEDFLSIDIF